MPGSTFRRARLALLAMTVTVAVSSLAGWSLTAWGDYRHDLEQAETRARNLARLVEEHAARTLEATGLTLARIVDRVATRGIDATAASAEDWQMFVRLAEDLPEVGSIMLVDAAGKVLLGTAERRPDMDVADREYFQAHRDGAQLHFGRGITARGSGMPTFTLSRRLQDRDGRFVGVVIALIHAGYFRSFYESLHLGEDAAIGIYRDDGAVIVRTPQPPAGAESITIRALFRTHLRQAPTATLVGPSSIDGIERVSSFARVSNSPLVVAVALGKRDVLAAWRERTTTNGLLLLAGGAMFGLLLFMTHAALRREEAGRAALAEANALLERRVLERTRELCAANERLKAALHERERAIDARIRFFAAANHDLRQPFQALRLFYDLLAARVTGEAECRVLQPMGEALSAGETLLSSLLDVSSLDGGRSDIAVEPVELAPLLARLTREIAPQAERAGLRFRAVPCSAVVLSDPRLLERMLRNLLSNAVKYTPAGGILLGCRRKGEAIQVEVIDTGAGIGDEHLDLIFEDFYQVGNPERDRRQGLGLGLGIVSRISTILGHRVTVASAPGKGTRFTVTLPRVRHHAAAAA